MKISLEEVRTKIIGSLRGINCVDDNINPYGIFVNGKQVRVRSGKYVWGQKRHASSALTNHIRYLVRERGIDRTDVATVLQCLKDEGVINVKEI